MPIRPINLHDLELVAARLEPLGIKTVFIGGAIVPLLVDNPEVAEVRSTIDVDVVFEVLTHLAYTKLEENLRAIGFKNDVSEGSPLCRYIIDNIRVDAIPVRDETNQFCDKWLDGALASASSRKIGDKMVNVITAPYFIATKLAAFSDRGKDDFMESKDIEDIVTIVDGRAALIDELSNVEFNLRQYIAEEVRKLIVNPRFFDALPGHLSPDVASQQRLPIVMERFQKIGALAS